MKTLLAGGLLLALMGCDSTLMSVDQGTLCVYNTDQQAQTCNAGQLAYFKPTEVRSPQAMLNVAAAYCDFNHPVLHNSGGVICVMTRQRL